MIIRQLSYPEALLWAVVPKQEWSKAATMKELLELVEKAASGQSYQEAIEEQEKLMKLPTEAQTSQMEQLRMKMEEAGRKGETSLWEQLRSQWDKLRKEIKPIQEAPTAKESLEDQLDRLVARLEELDSQGNLEISSEKTTETEQMTIQELSRAEQLLLSQNRES